MIDDDQEDFQIIEQIIKDIIHFEYSIEWTGSYSEGLKLIAKREHDVYLVDYKLGAKTGLDLIRKALEEGCEAPLIILTGDNNIEIDRQALKAGAADYLVKGSLSGQIIERAIRYSIANADQKKELNKLNTELEERVKNRTQALEETLARIEKFQEELIASKNDAERAAKFAEEASLSKTHFLSSMSHEIRTPMNAILGFTKVMQGTDLTAKQKEYMNAIKMSGDILIVLINDILDLAKVESGKMTFLKSPFKLSACIKEVSQLFDSQLSGKKVKLEQEYDPSIPEVVLGDRVRLDQIILNLLSNAIKFTHQGKITLRVRLVTEDVKKASVEFSVSDTGIGIPANKLDSIFEKFEQASDKTAKIYGGTGLGLSIVKQFVELQGGTVSVKSKVNEGSVFTFTLPFEKTRASVHTKEKDEQEITPAQKANLKDVKILVAEDEALNQLLIETILDQFGFQRDIAKNGKIAAELLQKNKYDIVLMDMHMPEMDGIEATKLIRAKISNSIPIIALTADVTTVDVDKCKAVGMNDYLSKPINEELLYAMINKYLKAPGSAKVKEQSTSKTATPVKHKIDLQYLDTLTNGNLAGKEKFIRLYLEEVPRLVERMKQGLENSDWKGLRLAAHSLVPSFSLMGVDKKFEDITRTIERDAENEENLGELPALVAEIATVCIEVCEELRIQTK